VAREKTYCPVCAERIEPSAKSCPRCSANLDEWSRKGFVDKLIGALDHPLYDVRMRAIIVLGKRREKSAERALVDCAMRHRADVVQGLEIVKSLRLIREGEATSWALDKLAKHHPARAVRQPAAKALESL
jgi:hypothetical protein